MRPHLRMAFLPPGASAALLRDAQLVSWNASTQRTGGAAVMIRVGVLETFEDQPLPLTTPLRGLVQVRNRGMSHPGRVSCCPPPPPSQAWFNPDYKINHTLGFNSSTSSLIVPVRSRAGVDTPGQAAPYPSAAAALLRRPWRQPPTPPTFMLSRTSSRSCPS